MDYRGPRMIEALKQKLGEEVEKLQYELNVTLPSEIRRRSRSVICARTANTRLRSSGSSLCRRASGSFGERLSKLSAIDLTQIPRDKVGLGSKVVVVDQQTVAKETYHLVIGDALEFEEGHVTMASPIGRALLGQAVGDVGAYSSCPRLCDS